jgi:hypothetical protein
LSAVKLTVGRDCGNVIKISFRMTQTNKAHFDGKAIIPDEPVQLPLGQHLTVWVELPDASESRFSGLLRFEIDLPGAPSDLSSQHDHYLYGSPKR